MQDLLRFLPTLVGQLEHNQTAREAFAFAAWRKMAGESLSERTSPVELNGEKLVVAVADATWKRNLEELAGQMVFKVNSTLRTQLVTFIEFRIDEEAVKAENRRDAVPADGGFDPAAEITDDIRTAASAIGDEHLREEFLKAAGSCLARKKRLGI